MTATWIRPFFVFAALYDGILGVAFLAFAGALFSYFGVEPPNHMAYIEFPALVLLIFSAMFFQVAAAPQRNRNLIPYGIGLKLAYSGTVLWYSLTGVMPAMWKPFAWADAGFLVLFFVAWRSLGATASSPAGR